MIKEETWLAEYEHYKHLFADYQEWKAWMIEQRDGKRPMAGDDMGVGILRTAFGIACLIAGTAMLIILALAHFGKP